MSQNPQPIKYGSIIHLENGAVDGGYLGSSRSLIEEDVLNWQDTAVLSFIFTHLFENRVGSSSWEVIPDPSANARPHFYIVNGLDGGETDPSLVSIRLDEPDGAYLFCDVNGAVTTLKDVTTDDQKRRATFKLVDGLAGEGKSFESVVFEHHFLRHTSLKLILTSKIGGDGIFQADATFFVGKTNSKDLIKSYNFPLHSIVSSSQNNAVVIENLSEPRKIDDELRYGDRIRLRNMHSVRSYLDIFDWVQQLKGPFEDYEAEMHNGVFTVDITIRPDHSEQKVFGEWLIQSADKPRKSGVVNEGDKIHLKSTYLLDKGHRHTTFYKPYSPPAESSFLVAHKEVTGNKQLQQGAYNGEKKFVFVGPKGGNNTQLEKGSKEWAITLSNSSQNFYYLWGEVDGKSVDYGSFELGEIVSKSLVRLILSADANKAAGNNKLVGKVSYAGEGILGLEATQKDGNIYSVEHTLNNSQLRDQILPLYPNGDWVFGARKDKKLIAVDIKSADGGQTFSGTFQYEGEEPVSVKGVQPSNKAFEKDGSPMFFNFFDPNDWLERIQKIGDRLAAPKTDIDQAVQAIALAKSATGQTAGLDTVSQTNQLENLRAFWGMMDEFWKAFDAVAQVEIPALHAQDILPPVNTITKCVRHTTIDFEIMQRAIQQRESAGDNNLAQARSLLITDKLADMSLAPFQFLFGDTNTTVTPITFFGKDVYIRQVPYSNQVMFIGLTYDLVASINDSNMPPFELLAIPHEMGHFLYHYENKTIFPAANQNSATHSHQVPAHNSGRFKHRPPTPHTIGWLSQHPDIQANPYHHWCEEIFADLFGCLVSGPFTALGIQAILATGDKERLMLDDALHPTPIMRPYLISEMLRVLSDKVDNFDFKETAMLLDANWTTILDRWGIVLEDVYNGRPASIIVPRDTAAHLEPFTRVNIQTAIGHSRKIMAHFADGLLAEYTNAAGNKHKADLSAGAWCTPQDTLTKYATAFGEMVQAKAKPEGADKTLKKIASPAAKLDLLESVPDTQNTLRNFVEVGATLFKNVAVGWHDSGPKSGNFGG